MNDSGTSEDISAETVPAEGWVYFVRSNKAVKIGYSTSLDRRLKDLQTSSHNRLELVAKVRGTWKTERRYHARFRFSRIKGEWFRLTPDIETEIKYIAKYGRPSRTPLGAPNPKPKIERSPEVFALDCKMRKSPDPIHRMAIQLLMELIQNHRPAKFIARQVKVLEAWG